MKRRTATSAEKVSAWEVAADAVYRACQTAPLHVAAFGDDPEQVRAHMLFVVMPSIRRRADIIRRNAPKRTKGRVRKPVSRG